MKTASAIQDTRKHFSIF